LHIELQALQLYAGLVGAIVDGNLAKVGLGGLGTNAREFGAPDGNAIISFGGRIIEQFQLGLFTHFLFTTKALRH
jgi:hypothetical protein